MGHWYKSDGSPFYTMKGKNGKERDVTLRDAKVHDAWPSVTTILQVKASPGLDNYKQQQLLDAAWDTDIFDYYERDLPREQSKEIWSKEIVNKSKQHAKKASDRGTQIHDALEDWANGKTTNLSDDDLLIVGRAWDFLKKEFPKANWRAERSFCSKLGFGGKVDLSDEYGIILDFKTKDTDDIKKMVGYENHKMQTAAYAVGLGMPGADRYNLFISTQVPGLLKLEKHEDFDRDWNMFRSLLDYWHLSTGHKPDKSYLGEFKHG